MKLNLNWKEIHRLTELYQGFLEDQYIDRLLIPDRPYLPSGFLKNEFALRIKMRRGEVLLVIGLRPGGPYFYLKDGKGHRASTRSTFSPFEQSLAKEIPGKKIERIEAIPQERSILLWLAGTKKRCLALNLIPARPEAFLLEEVKGNLKILFGNRLQEREVELYKIPEGKKAPKDLDTREEWLGGPFEFGKYVEGEIKSSAFRERLKKAEKQITELKKTASKQLKVAESALKRAKDEPDWNYFGDLLKASLHLNPKAQKKDGKWVREVLDHASGKTILIPADRKLKASDDLSRLFTLSKKNKRRIQESQERFDSAKMDLDGKIKKFLETVEKLESTADFDALSALESELGLSPKTRETLKKRRKWNGKTFLSSDGLPIWVGKNKRENSELTFKFARGNDIWMHVRGKPGAHVVIPLESGKSAPLDTLLDAATIALFFSGGQEWGKTEVDYTFRKNVRRIKKSSEVSYRGNKTLTVDFDLERKKRLFSGQNV